MDKEPREEIGEGDDEEEEEEEEKYTEEELGNHLITAVKDNNLEDTQFWINKSAPVSAVDKMGWSSLLWACCNGNEELVRLLLRHKA